MNASVHFLAAERGDYPLDLAPVAKSRHISRIAALLGANGGLESGVVAEPLDEIGGVKKRRPA